jgi:RHS repeat-associated protein
VSYTYNADGTLASKKDANNNTETYTYDAYQRLTAIPDRQQTFTYDTCPTNATGCVSMAGQLMQATFGSDVGPNELSFEYNYAYTPAGKVASKTLQVQSANHLSMWDVQASGALTASYNYDNQGALTSAVYPQLATWPPGSIQTFTYTLDAMERPTGLTDNYWNRTWASGATYNAANQPLYDGTATRTYNSLLQMTSITGSGMNMTYNYSTTRNNGQITSSVDAISEETITYQYDLLKRLESASGSGSLSGKNWGETYTYDGFGNMTQMAPTGTAGAPSLSVTVNANTNRLTPSGAQYDNNGNLLTWFLGIEPVYDVANRLSEVMESAGNSYYGYDSDNLRIYYRNTGNSETIYFYGADGKKLATYACTMITYNGDPEIQLLEQSENVYFLGKLVWAEDYAVSTDRLGSVRYGGPGGVGYQAQFPYGVEYTTTVNDREKYATYTRDSLTGLDYAMNRYYSSQWGRFLSPDPYGGSVAPGSPQSWNRYAYVGGDPANGNDPSGLLLPGPGGPGGPDAPVGPVWGFNPGGGDGFGGGGSGDQGGSTPCFDIASRVRMDPFFRPCGGGGGGDVLQEALSDATNALHNKDCGAVFNTRANLSMKYDPAQVLEGFVDGIKLGDPYFGSLWAEQLAPTLAAQTQYGNGQWVGGSYEYTSANIILQDNGPNSYLQQSPASLALTLIHELGHVFSIVAALGGSTIQYDANPDGTPNDAAEAANAKALAPCAKALGLKQ